MVYSDAVKQYLDGSTIHGMRYLASSSIWVKLFWSGVVITFFTLAGAVIWEANEGWNESPTITSVTLHDVASIPFPDIVVCARASKKWVEIMNEMRDFDEGQGISALFRQVPQLTEALMIAITNAAPFLLIRDLLESSDFTRNLKHVKDKLNAKICREDNDLKRVLKNVHQRKAFNLPYATRQMLANEALQGKSSVLYDNPDATPLNWTRSECEKASLDDYEGEHIKLAKEVLLYHELDRDQLFILLMRVMALAENEELRKGTQNLIPDPVPIFKYFESFGKGQRPFGDLPLPVSLGLMNMRSYNMQFDPRPTMPSRISFWRSYGNESWHSLYDRFHNCLAHDQDCQFMDSLFLQDKEKYVQSWRDTEYHSSLDKFAHDIGSAPLVPFCKFRGKLMGQAGHEFGLPFSDKLCSIMSRIPVTNDCFVFKATEADEEGGQFFTLSEELGLTLFIDRGVASSHFKGVWPYDNLVIHIQDPNANFPDILQLEVTDLKIKLGMETTIQLDAQIFNATKQYLNTPLDMTVRDCLNENEVEVHPLNFMDKYNRNNCILDQMETKVVNETKCLVPSLTSNHYHNVATCGPSALVSRFHGIVQTFFNGSEMTKMIEKCLFTCTGVVYKGSIAQEVPIKVSGVSEGHFLYKYLFNSDNKTNFMNYVAFETYATSFLQERLDQVAVVNLNFGRAFVEKLTVNTRTTFSSRLSAIGGTLGLFTGFSLVSALEIPFWIFQAFSRR